MKLEKYSIGFGDRFMQNGRAQLKAVMKACKSGIDIVPVWNKSHREHTAAGTSHEQTRSKADRAVEALGWNGSYYVDADHVSLSNIKHFISASDFFTLDVSDYIGKSIDDDEIDRFVEKHKDLNGSLTMPGIGTPLRLSLEQIRATAQKYLPAVKEAGKIYSFIESEKGAGNFITEVTIDEAEKPQSALELLLILAAIADEGIPVQTIAPKFTGRFNKGVDYYGDAAKFAQEFETAVAVTKYAVRIFDLPENLKLSLHSGSDKFSIYPAVKNALSKHEVGLHLKTAGTSWLEEVITLAEAGDDGLAAVKRIYNGAAEKYFKLCKPHAATIDIQKKNLPSCEAVEEWTGSHFATVLRHDPDSDDYNPDFRQLMYVAYQVAAEMGEEYTGLLDKYQEKIAENVEENILNRHIFRVFPIN